MILLVIIFYGQGSVAVYVWLFRMLYVVLATIVGLSELLEVLQQACKLLLLLKHRKQL